MDERMTIVFICFDGYSDIWSDCINLFKVHWKECPYKIMLVNNTKEVMYDGVEIFHAGEDAEWSKKVQLAIEKAKSPYICLLLEDFLVGDVIDSNVINETLDYISQENIRYFKLVNMSRAVKNKDLYYNGSKFLHVIPQSDEYGVSLQAAIWERDYLKELVGKDNYNAWIFEFNQVKAARGKKNEPMPGCVFDERNILNLQHGIVQGKYLPCTINYFKKKGIELNVEREVMSYFQYYKIRLISKGKYLIPQKLREPVKKILEKAGMKFVSTIRDK